MHPETYTDRITVQGPSVLLGGMAMDELFDQILDPAANNADRLLSDIGLAALHIGLGIWKTESDSDSELSWQIQVKVANP